MLVSAIEISNFKTSMCDDITKGDQIVKQAGQTDDDQNDTSTQDSQQTT